MKTYSLTLSATLLTVLVANFANAQPPGGSGEGRQGDAQGLLDRVMNFDENQDGKLSKAEMPERLQGMFARSDKDEDGLLTPDELRHGLEHRDGGRRGEGRPDGEAGRGRGDGDRRGGGFGRGPEGSRGMPLFPVMKALDSDGDGEISADEMKGATLALKSLDRNKDGRLDHSELRPEFGRPPGDRGPFGGGDPGAMVDGLLKRMDKDQDGKLSGKEIPERMQEHLNRIDRNSDNVVDRAELEEMAKQIAKGGGPRDGRDGQRGQRRRPPTEE